MSNEENTGVSVSDELLAELASPEPTKKEEVEPKSIYGIYTPSELKELHDRYKAMPNIDATLYDIARRLFRHNNIRVLAELNIPEDENRIRLYHDLKFHFQSIQEQVLTKNKIVNSKIRHKKGDVVRDERGNPVLEATKVDGTPVYETYKKDTIEYAEKVEEVPYYDFRNSNTAKMALDKWLSETVVLPDFGLLERELTKDIDYGRGLDIIREITKYYQFEEPVKFANRFALLICNAKAKGLNKQPKWPVMFSLVGKMGKGKGWFASMLMKTYDETFHTQSNKTSFKRLLSGNYNSVMMTRGFIHFDEKNGMDSSQAEELKTLITEPLVALNRKYREDATIKNLTTFFSTTNESIKDVMGAQQDRRLVEFVLANKTTEIPEKKMEELLKELWRVMPIEHPNPDSIINELLSESKSMLDARMEEVVSRLFDDEHLEDLMEGKYVNRTKLKEAIKKNCSSVRYQSFVDWCVEEGILKPNHGHIYLSRKNLKEVMKRIEWDKIHDVCGDDKVSDLLPPDVDVEEI